MFNAKQTVGVQLDKEKLLAICDDINKCEMRMKIAYLDNAKDSNDDRGKKRYSLLEM